MIEWMKNHKLIMGALAGLLIAMGSEGVLPEGGVRLFLDLIHAIIDTITGTNPHATA